MKGAPKVTLAEFKTSIELKAVGDTPIIFQYDDVPFVANQYIREISKIKGKKIEYLESIDTIGSTVADIFGVSTTADSIRVYNCSELEMLSEKFKYETDIYIVVNKIKDKQLQTIFADYIINIPKLEGWQLQDYMYSVAEGVDRKQLDWLISACNGDIYRLENELDKFRLFSETERKYLFNDMIHEGAFVDLSSFNVFNITNAVTSRDIESLKLAMKEIKSFDAEPLGVVTLLYQGFRKLIQVWMSSNPTPEGTGLKSNVIYAINKQPKVFNKEQLVNSFQLLNNIDKELKSGNIDVKWLIDYVICRVLTY